MRLLSVSIVPIAGLAANAAASASLWRCSSAAFSAASRSALSLAALAAAALERFVAFCFSFVD